MRALSNDAIAGWLRSTAEELFAVAQFLDSGYLIRGIEAQREQESLERIVRILEPCRTPPMPPLSGRPQTLQPLRLTRELLDAIGLRQEDINLLVSRLPLVEGMANRLSGGTESIVKQLTEQNAPLDAIEKMRLASAKLALLREFLKIPLA